MGVLECRRSGCGSIMCDTDVLDIGYVCGDCQIEFEKYLHAVSAAPTTHEEILTQLSMFMKTYKDEFVFNEGMSIAVFFNQYTNNT